MYTYCKSLLTVAFYLYAAAGIAQTPPVPQMWVSRDNSQKRTAQFNTVIYSSAGKSKEDILTGVININGVVEPPGYTYLVYTYNQLLGEILADDNGSAGKGLRLYIGAYDPATPAQGIDPAQTIDMTGVQDKQLVIIFAPAVDTFKKDVGTYYFIGPNDGVVYKIDPQTMKAWTDHYVQYDDNSTGLLKTIDLTDAKNRMPVPAGQPPVYSDTRAIYYDTAAFVAFLKTEVDYQTRQNRKPDMITMNFAAYTKDGGPYGGYVDRLIVLFEFVKNGNIIYIDDTPGFCQRTNAHCAIPSRGTKLKAVQSDKGGDNGQLCPPNCPCQTCK